MVKQNNRVTKIDSAQYNMLIAMVYSQEVLAAPIENKLAAHG